MVRENIYIKKEPLSTEDTELLRKIAIDSYLDHFRYLWSDDGAWYLDRVYSLTTLKNELLDSNNQFFIAYQDDEPVGFLKIKLDHPLSEIESKEALELEKIYVRASSRGLGIGKRFLELTFQKAIELRKKIIWLKVMDSSLDSIAFYQKNGFVACGTHSLNFETMLPEYRGMIIMRRNISHANLL